MDLLRDGSGYDPSVILVLINQLPLASRTIAALRGGEQFIGWDVDRYFMATLIDAVNQVSYVTAAANSKRKPRAPKPISRPSKAQKNPADNNPFRQRLAAAKKAKGG